MQEEDTSKWVANFMKKIYCYFKILDMLKQFHELKMLVLQPLGVHRELSDSSEMQNDALMHPEGLKG